MELRREAEKQRKSTKSLKKPLFHQESVTEMELKKKVEKLKPQSTIGSLFALTVIDANSGSRN